MNDLAQPYHHGNLRLALLEKAKQHLIENGPDKISLRALARDVGVSQTAPYRHFPDKTTLLAALAAEGFKQLNEASQRADDHGPIVTERLAKTGRAYVQFALDNPELYRLMFGPLIPAENEFKELNDYGARAYESIVLLVTEGIKAKEFTEGDPLILANSAWSLVHGVASLMIDNRFACTEGEISEAHLEQVISLVSEGLRIRT